MGGKSPRALEPDEVRDELIRQMKSIAKYWAESERAGDTLDRIEGAMFSTLSMLDGCTLGFPAFDLVATPHEDDKQFCIDRGENWIEPETRISEMLHEHWHRVS